MTHFRKVKIWTLLRWVSSNFKDINKNPLLLFARNPRFYSRKGASGSEKTIDALDKNVERNARKTLQISRKVKKEAQAVLLDYLHHTRSMRFVDAENMSKNSPQFLEMLLGKVGVEGEVGESLARFLRYHPINEFEPFFESLGLEPHEYGPFLHRDLMFLSDNALLVENYHVLCNFDIPRNKIGKIYKGATEVFGYGTGVLALKLQSYEELGLSHSFVVKAAICSPYLLIGDVDKDFVRVLKILRMGGIELRWIEEHLLEISFLNWSKLLALLNLLSNSGYSEEELGAIVSQSPGILFENSGDMTMMLIGFLVKFGLALDRICSMFQQFPKMEVGTFIRNLRNCFLFLNDIEMEVCDIGKLFCSHPILLGSCALKKPNSLCTYLNVGKKRLAKLVLENPQEMQKWVLGSKVARLPSEGQPRSKKLKSEFLMETGLVDSPNKIENWLKVLRGKGTEIQERFDTIVEAGVDKNDVFQMIKAAPEILNQKKGILKMKIDFLVNDLRYPISSLVSFPGYLKYTAQRVKLRVEMYNWLKDQGMMDSHLSLSTVVVCSEKVFVSLFLRNHPRGLDVWQKLKREIYPS